MRPFVRTPSSSLLNLPAVARTRSHGEITTLWYAVLGTPSIFPVQIKLSATVFELQEAIVAYPSVRGLCHASDACLYLATDECGRWFCDDDTIEAVRSGRITSIGRERMKPWATLADSYFGANFKTEDGDIHILAKLMPNVIRFPRAPRGNVKVPKPPVQTSGTGNGHAGTQELRKCGWQANTTGTKSGTSTCDSLVSCPSGKSDSNDVTSLVVVHYTVVDHSTNGVGDVAGWLRFLLSCLLPNFAGMSKKFV